MMDRKEFLSKLGIGAAFALTSSCLGACTKEAIAPTGTVDFTLDLADTANAKLLSDGGYLIKNRIVVARTNTGEYVAATQTCSHEGRNKIVYRNEEWYCTDHGARFSLNGDGLNGNGRKGLSIYKTALEGEVLRVYSS